MLSRERTDALDDHVGKKNEVEHGDGQILSVEGRPLRSAMADPRPRPRRQEQGSSLKRKCYAAPFLVASAIVLMAVIFGRGRGVQPITVRCWGTTNDSAGQTLYCFQATNSTRQDVQGAYLLEVFHLGYWFNAFPQPERVNHFVVVPAMGVKVFAVPAPTGRAEQGLELQPNPPGEKWRYVFSYKASRYRDDLLGAVMRRLTRLVRKDPEIGFRSYSPGISFVKASELEK